MGLSCLSGRVAVERGSLKRPAMVKPSDGGRTVLGAWHFARDREGKRCVEKAV